MLFKLIRFFRNMGCVASILKLHKYPSIIKPTPNFTFHCKCTTRKCKRECGVAPENEEEDDEYSCFDTDQVLPLSTKPVKSYRFWIGNGHTKGCYANMITDREYFNDKVFITHRELFENGEEDYLYQLAKEENFIIKDLADFDGCGPQSLFTFITGKTLTFTKQKEVDVLNLLGLYYIKHMIAKDYHFVADTIKAMLAIFDSNFIIMDMTTRVITPVNCEFDTVEEMFYNVIQKDSLRYNYKDDKFCLYYNGSDTPLYQDPGFHHMEYVFENLKYNITALMFTFGEIGYSSKTDDFTKIPFLPMVSSRACVDYDSRPFDESINTLGYIELKLKKQHLVVYDAYTCYDTYTPLEESEFEYYNQIKYYQNYFDREKYKYIESNIPKHILLWYAQQPSRYPKKN